MDPGPHQEHHTHHHSGMRWLDMAVGLSAILISVVSLWVAVQHGKTMEQMVEATTWPYVEMAHSNLNAAGEPEISLSVFNSGVGPARVESFEVWYDGKPMRDGVDLLTACCTPPERPHFISSGVPDRVMPAKETIVFFKASPERMTPEQFARLDKARSKLKGRICYCSVLDECWLRESDKPRPDKVKSCPKPAVTYFDK